MQKILKNIHLLFWGTIPIFLLYGFTQFDKLIDVNIHDTMFVFPVKYIAFVLSFLFFITGLGYYLSYQSGTFRPVNVLTMLHVVFITTGLLVLFLLPEYPYDLSVENATDIEENRKVTNRYEDMRFYSWMGILLAQLILLLNLTISIFRKYTDTTL